MLAVATPTVRVGIPLLESALYSAYRHPFCQVGLEGRATWVFYNDEEDIFHFVNNDKLGAEFFAELYSVPEIARRLAEEP